MDVVQLKTFIFEENRVEEILQDIGCHHIYYHSSSAYWTCANKDGDNKQAIVIRNNEYLPCTNYTRQMVKMNRKTDLIDLVCFNKELNFPEALKYICNLIGLEYYHDFNEDVPESLQITDLVFKMQTNDDYFIDKPLRPISEKILSYYDNRVNDLFLKDNISYETQCDFQIGYDSESNRITIPIFSEIGDLVGVKGRLFKSNLSKSDLKYIYIEPCPRRRIIYGLNKTMPYIKRSGRIYVPEAEKGVMQLWSYGDKNAGATGGKELSNQQIELLTRLSAEIVFVQDKDVTKEEISNIADQFVDGIPIYCIYDESNILEDKESPTDNPKKWEFMKKNNMYRIR